jgi:hypothetical protein
VQEVLKMPQCSGHLISSAAARHKNESHPTVSGRSILSWSRRINQQCCRESRRRRKGGGRGRWDEVSVEGVECEVLCSRLWLSVDESISRGVLWLDEATHARTGKLLALRDHFITSQHQTATTKLCNCSPFDVRFDSVPIEIISYSLKCWFMFLPSYELRLVSSGLGNSYMFLFTFRTFTPANVLYVFRILNLALITA